MALLAILSALALAGTGCGGLNAAPAISPATFLMPGFFGQASDPNPAPAQPADAPEDVSVQSFAPAP